MRYQLFIIFLLLPAIGLPNMAKPWIDGAIHSPLFSNNKCIVQHERIVIGLDTARPAVANYKITYNIISETDQSILLVFLGIDLSQKKKIYVNDKLTADIPLENVADFPFLTYLDEEYVEIKYTKQQRKRVRKEELIHFKADLKKGENTIFIEYEGVMKHNRFGFVQTYKLEYSLYPSKFWEYFGEIEVELDLGDQFKIVGSNYKYRTRDKHLVQWKIPAIDEDVFEAKIRLKTPLLATILLTLQPEGIAFIVFLFLAFIHYKTLVKKYLSENTNFEYALSLGNFIIPVLFYVVYMYSYKLIDWSLDNTHANHGYYFLIIITLPLFWLVYSIIMWIIDRVFLKRKYSKI